MADMRTSEQQWLAALALMVTALFVSAGLPLAPQWRRRFRIAAIGVFLVAVVVVFALIAQWLADGGR
jgi:hypothetical protein